MRKKTIKLSKLILVFMMLFSTIAFQVNANGQIKAEMLDYEIYPNPHSITYQSGEYIMKNEVNVVYDETIDEATKKRFAEIMASKNKNVTISTVKDNSKMNVFVGTYNSDGNAFQYAKENYTFEASLFEKFDAHKVISNNGEIVVIGKDSDAAFYGLTSIKLIFNQIDGSTIRNFTIEDYADTAIRGFIEGYYGIPWSNADRMSLMKLGGDFKMTAYVFAPKNDPYHTNKWREPYPEAELAAIQEMVQVGNDSKTRFVWTAHPFMGGFNANDKQNEINRLIAKFEQLYGVGVRQFGVLGDDVGSLDKATIIEILTAVSDWAKSKGDVYDTMFCPAGYNHSWQGDYSELNAYDKGFPKDVQIFWTGEAVCQPIEQKTLEHFRRYNLPAETTQRRSPLFWLNWPVNDIQPNRLLMGKGSLLRTDINIEDLAGVVTNPMQEAEASKVAIFAVADYSWNVKGFNADQSWVDSFKYIEPNASEALHTLAKHMSNPEPNGHGLVLAESEELSPLLNQFKTALANNQSIAQLGTQLMQEMDIIINAADTFNANSTNEKLKEEMGSFVASLKELAFANKNFIKAAIALENNEKSLAFDAYMEASSSFASAKQNTKTKLDGSQINVAPGYTHLIPFAQNLEKALSGEIGKITSGEQEVFKITGSSSFNSFYGGTKIENIVDGKNDTYAWYGGYEAVNQYFQIDFNMPKDIYGIHVLNGTSSKPQDTFGKDKLVYSTDNGVSWKDVNGDVYGDYAQEVRVSGIKLDHVTNVRYVSVERGSGNKWPAMREFSVDTEVSFAPQFSAEVIRTKEEGSWGIYSGSDANLIDGNETTSVLYRVRNSNDLGADKDCMLPGDFVGVKLSQPITLGKIRVVQKQSSDDYMKNADLEYSMDGTNWTKIQSYTNTRTIAVDVSSQNIRAQYVRIKNTQKQNNWLEMNEFKVESKVFFNQNVYTNADAYKTMKALILPNSGELDSTNNVTLQKDQYIGLKLNRIHVIKEFVTNITNSNLTLQVSKNGYEWEPATKETIVGAEARYVRLINLSDNTQTFDVTTFKVQADEVKEKSISKLSGFNIYGDKETANNVFDKNRATQTVYNGSQNAGSYFVYDLGQTIDLNSFKAVTKDGENDYPRHGKFSVSEDGVNWTSIMTLGNQDSANPGEAENKDDINYVLPDHEISYNAKAVTGLDVKARYLKFEITRTKVGSDKWVRFQEFEINDGAFIPTENDPTIYATAKQSEQALFKSITDNDLSTSFAPKETTGTLTYQVSENNETLNTIKMIQNSKVISNAVVKVRVLPKADMENEQIVTLGTLSQTINTFVLPEDVAVLDVMIEWNDAKLNLIECMILKSSDAKADKTVLKDMLDNRVDVSTWTTDTKNAYANALNVAQSVYDSQGIAQSSVASAIEMINIAIQNKAIKGDVTALKAAFDTAPSDASVYTVKSWTNYQKVYNATNTMIQNKANYSQTQMDAQLTNLTSAKDALVFNPTNSEIASLLKIEIDAFIAATSDPNSIYTRQSFNALLDANATLSALLDKNAQTPQNPNDFVGAISALKDARANLVQVLNIPALVAEYEKTNASLYTADSFKNYEDAINVVKAYLENGTKEQIEQGIKAVESAKAALEMTTTDFTQINAYITQLEGLQASDYTSKSYATLMDTIREIKAKLVGATDADVAMYLVQLETANAKLVNVTSLQAKVAQAKAFEAAKYTTSSYANLTSAIADAEKCYVDGTKAEVSQSINAIDFAIKKLDVVVNNKEAKDYIDALRKANAAAYTKESYAKYEDAFNALKALAKNLDDVSARQFVDAKAKFEKAVDQLKLVKHPENTKPEKPAGNPSVTPKPDPDTIGRVLPVLGAQVERADVPAKKEVKEAEKDKGNTNNKKEEVKEEETPKANIEKEATNGSMWIAAGAVLLAAGGHSYF